jgi:hypothetical protein
MSVCKAEPPLIIHFYGSFFTLKSKLIGLEKGTFCLVKIQGLVSSDIYSTDLLNSYYELLKSHYESQT